MMSHDADDLYEWLILDHYDSSPYRGKLSEHTVSCRERNPVCGDAVRLDLEFDGDNRITQVRFEAQGCIISQAAASILCEHIEGKRFGDLKEFTAEDMLKLLQVPLVPRRVQCGLLPFRALKAIVYSADCSSAKECPEA